MPSSTAPPANIKSGKTAVGTSSRGSVGAPEPAHSGTAASAVPESPVARDLPNVIFVDTPLQMLNAMEAKSSMGLSNTTLVVVGSGTRRLQLDALIDERDWDVVHRVTGMSNVTGASPRLESLQALRSARQQIDAFVRRLGGANALFIGNYGSPLARHLASTLSHRRLFLLDDGVATITYAERRELARPRSPSVRRLKRRLRDAALGLRRHEPESLTFFTSYDVRGSSRDRVVRNAYARLRAQVVGGTLVPETLFLGQPLVEDNQVSPDVYVRFVRAAQRDGGSAPLVYAPHPRESSDRVAYLRQLLGCEVRIHALPVEVELARSRRRPTTVASFCSSALDNCRILFDGTGMSIVAYVIDDHDLLEGNNGTFGQMYDYFRRHEAPGFSLRTIDAAQTPLAPAADASEVPSLGSAGSS